MPRHNSSSSLALPRELPAQLLSAWLVWVRCGGTVPPLRLLYDSPYAVIHRGSRSFMLRIGSTEEFVAVSRLKACTTTDAAPGSPRRRWASARRFRRGQVPRQLRRSQVGIVCAPLGLYTFNNGAAAKRSRNRFPTQCEGFCTPGTGGTTNVSTAAESAAPADTAAVSATPVYTAS